MPSESIHSFAALQNRLKIAGTLVALTALRIGAGRDTEVTSNDLPVLRDALGRPFIPGASLKGTLRARVEALINTIAPQQVRDFDELEAFQRTEIVVLKNEFQDQDRALSDAIWKHSTLIDLTFGAPWVAGRLFLKDAQVLSSAKLGLFEVRNGVAINRDTETVDGGKLYDFEVVPAGTRFQFELTMENAEHWQLGMLLLALKPWERGDVQVGGFRSRGLGYVQLIDMQRQFTNIKGVDDVIALLSGDAPADNITLEQAQSWGQAFREKLISVVPA